MEQVITFFLCPVTVQDTGLVRFHGSDIIFQFPGIRAEVFKASFQILQGVQVPGFIAFSVSGNHVQPDSHALMGFTDGLQFFPDALVEVIQLIPDDGFPGQGDHLVGRQFFRSSQELNAVKVNEFYPLTVLNHVDGDLFIPCILAFIRFKLYRTVICPFSIRDFHVVNLVVQGLQAQQLIDLPLRLCPADSLGTRERVRQAIPVTLRPFAEEIPEAIQLIVVQGIRIRADVFDFFRCRREGILHCGFRRFRLLLGLRLHVRADHAQRELNIPETIFAFLGVCCLNRQRQLFRLFLSVIQYILIVRRTASVPVQRAVRKVPVIEIIILSINQEIGIAVIIRIHFELHMQFSVNPADTINSNTRHHLEIQRLAAVQDLLFFLCQFPAFMLVIAVTHIRRSCCHILRFSLALRNRT